MSFSTYSIFFTQRSGFYVGTGINKNVTKTLRRGKNEIVVLKMLSTVITWTYQNKCRNVKSNESFMFTFIMNMDELQRFK